MSAYAGRANPSFAAVLTNHSGASRPSYAVAHTKWLKIVSGTAWEMYLYDGTDDILVGTINPTANTFTLNSSGLGFPTSYVMRNETSPLSFVNGRIVATQGANGEGTIELKGKTTGSYDASFIKWTNGNTGERLFELISNSSTSIKLRDSAAADVFSFLATGDINSKLWGNLGDQIVPPGATVLFPFTSAPPGYITKSGVLLSRAAYPRLWTYAQTYGKLVTEAAWAAGAYGAFSTGDLSTTFRIPHDNGYFHRAVKDEATYTIGTYRADANKTHNHTGTTGSGGVQHTHLYDISQLATGPGSVPAPQPLGSGAGNYGTGNATAYLHTHTISSDGATEGEPRNIPLLACIKY